MATYLLLPGTDELKTADFKGAHRVLVHQWAPRGRSKSEVLVQALVFSHPVKGDHTVYLDVALLDAAGVPSPAVYDAAANLVEQACSGRGNAADFYREHGGGGNLEGHFTRHKFRRLDDGTSVFGSREHAKTAARASGTIVIGG